MTPPDISVVISSYSRRQLLSRSLDALDRQNYAGAFEVIVVDNGSEDGTSEMLHALQPATRRGRVLVFLSDDFVVPPEYLRITVELSGLPGYWLVGEMKQLEALSATPFGRFLNELEAGFEEARKTRAFGEHVWEISYPTLRNLALSRADLDRVGVFDEHFPFGCEDQDLAERAMSAGIRFAYATRPIAVHNDGSDSRRVLAA
jgi:GT2 family glycosyltransferase